MFQREDWELFRNVDTLSQKAGVPKTRLAALVFKELVDNALDIADICTISRQGDTVIICDNGPGILHDRLPELFSICRPLMSSKLLRLPSRGCMGNGLRVAAGAVLATGGRLVVSTCGKSFLLIPQNDGQTIAKYAGEYTLSGTKVKITLGTAAGPVDLSMAKRALLFTGGEYYKGKTSPYWYTVTAFHELCLAAKGTCIRELIAMFDGCSGARAGQISAAYKGRMATTLNREEAAVLLLAMRKTTLPVKLGRLGSIGLAEGLPLSYGRNTGQYELNDGRGGVSAIIPFVVEVWAELSEQPSIFAHVNRTAVIGEMSAYHSKGDTQIFGCGLSHSFDTGRRPFALWLHILTPYMPIQSDGKVPDFLPMLQGIHDAIHKATGKAKRLQPSIRIEQRRCSQKDIIFETIPAAIQKAGGSGQYRFSQRQLYYAVRPAVITELGHEPEYDYFCRLLTEYENSNGDISGLYRDERGTLYHPHTGEVIPIGTISVEGYQRPEWTFHKILYCEKEGFFPILRAAKWPERHDCALLTSKGFASRAARDLLDMMGDTGEPISIFCIHDADAAGTMIYQSLQEGTATMPGRSVQIINLGLEPEEALLMGLEMETIDKHRRQPVAGYVPDKWAQWLQNNRVELNAMPTPIFLQWLNDKMAQHGNGKLVPPQRVLIDTFHDRTQQEVKRRIIDEVLRTADINRMTSRKMSDISVALEQQAAALMGTVVNVLDQEPASSWREVVEMLACGVVSG